MAEKCYSRMNKAKIGMGGTTKPAAVMSKVNGRAKKAGHGGNGSTVAGKVASRMGKAGGKKSAKKSMMKKSGY